MRRVPEGIGGSSRESPCPRGGSLPEERGLSPLSIPTPSLQTASSLPGKAGRRFWARMSQPGQIPCGIWGHPRRSSPIPPLRRRPQGMLGSDVGNEMDKRREFLGNCRLWNIPAALLLLPPLLRLSLLSLELSMERGWERLQEAGIVFPLPRLSRDIHAGDPGSCFSLPAIPQGSPSRAPRGAPAQAKGAAGQTFPKNPHVPTSLPLSKASVGAPRQFPAGKAAPDPISPRAGCPYNPNSWNSEAAWGLSAFKPHLCPFGPKKTPLNPWISMLRIRRWDPGWLPVSLKREKT